MRWCVESRRCAPLVNDVARDRRSGPKTTPLTVAQSRVHFTKATQFLRSAEVALNAGDLDAAGANAVLATVNAADCVCGLVLGNRWGGAHEQASAHVAKAGESGKSIAVQLRKTLRKKSQAHYEAVPLTSKEATDMVVAARRALGSAAYEMAKVDARQM